MEDELLTAALHGHTSDAQRLLDNGASVHSTNSRGATALLVAAENGHTDVVAVLLAAKAGVNHADLNGETPLFAASRRGHRDVVRVLLDAGANVDKSLQLGFQDRGVRLRPGATPLLAAARFGHEETVRVLLSAKPNINAFDESGELAVTAAACAGHASIVHLILHENSDYNEPAEMTVVGSFSPAPSRLNHVMSQHDLGLSYAPAATDSFERLRGRELVDAVVASDAAAVKALVALGAHPNATNAEGESALHLAVRYGEPRILEMLLRAPGVDSQARNPDGETPLVLAIKLRHRRFPHQIYNVVHQIADDVHETAIQINANALLGDGGFGYVHKGMYKNELVAVNGELRPSVSADCAPWYKALADDCLSFDPKQRPTAQTIIDRLLLQEKALAGREPVAAPETKTERLMTPPQLTKGMSSSSSTSSTSSSWSSGALTSRLPCRMCKTRNAALNQHCSSCNEAMPDESTKLALLLKRAKVANAKGFSINLCIDCDICETTNVMTAATCIDPECGEELLDDAEKLRILTRRFDLATSSA
ncbi:hypothetical protein SDRG_06215 [Saprolegnia diclina VS20]|uniref:Uncharacterized protein n=1 Tax=Saprolegnia diclina (strain VS20) TaxID=1156394 RepID=T0RUH4_SAPDV|nr:hypothetical protein SDRG_06215 [Saprolegnia diclina VS20]EQC36098.1 hypothetical protein SDRG_06215 [Saprolegnia diclina VS20]|eukprot:XP_008610204.1 hypothetical protein SDRG_06215 [Saprolegnia diclina VS20]